MTATPRADDSLPRPKGPAFSPPRTSALIRRKTRNARRAGGSSAGLPLATAAVALVARSGANSAERAVPCFGAATCMSALVLTRRAALGQLPDWTLPSRPLWKHRSCRFGRLSDVRLAHIPTPVAEEGGPVELDFLNGEGSPYASWL
jgi:hypothetical protein